MNPLVIHECPECGQMCDCDGEDLFYPIPPHDCECEEGHHEFDGEHYEDDE